MSTIVKNRNLCQKMYVENLNLSKIEITVKNRNFWEKSKFLSKIFMMPTLKFIIIVKIIAAVLNRLDNKAAKNINKNPINIPLYWKCKWSTRNNPKFPIIKNGKIYLLFSPTPSAFP